MPKIATENSVQDLDELKEWLKAQGHPITERWQDMPTAEKGPEKIVQPSQAAMTEHFVPTLELPASALPVQGLPSGMNFKIILKNAKIKAESMIIRVDKEKR
jgi:CO dehydrogenase/acetyl-CoA synthase beta subunit